MKNFKMFLFSIAISFVAVSMTSCEHVVQTLLDAYVNNYSVNGKEEKKAIAWVGKAEFEGFTTVVLLTSQPQKDGIANLAAASNYIILHYKTSKFGGNKKVDLPLYTNTKDLEWAIYFRDDTGIKEEILSTNVSSIASGSTVSLPTQQEENKETGLSVQFKVKLKKGNSIEGKYLGIFHTHDGSFDGKGSDIWKAKLYNYKKYKK